MELGTVEVLRMMSLASVMTEHRFRFGIRTPEYADMATSMCDLRSAVNVGRAVPLEHITGQGYPDLDYIRAHRQGRRA
ncbi:hypothetical protein ACIQUM_31600 [Amycolatopsis azurea]|uniref:hypothetical protein n=1 Tax=Amycolatopsis azurea TaxID=36819 RepID=UPI0037FD5351